MKSPQCRPESDKDPQKYYRYNKTDRYGNQCTDSHPEGTDEHLLLYEFLEENLRNNEQQSSRNDRYGKERKKDQQP